MKARRAKVTLIYEGVDISADVAPFLLSFSFSDHAEDKADDLQVTFQDREGLWKRDWYPSKGATMVAAIETKEWEGSLSRLPCGTFSIDEIDASGSPDTVTLKGVPELVKTSLRRERKTKAWEDISLSKIASEIAGIAGVELFYDVDEDPQYSRRDQREQTDLAFLRNLCDDAGLSLKLSNGRLVIFDAEKYEAMPPVATIKKGDISRYSFSSKSADIYKSCTVKYHDAEKKELLSYTYVPDPEPEVGQELQIRRRVESLANAESLARKELRKANRHEVTGSMTTAGNVLLSAGLNVTVSGFGRFDGTYHVEKAVHSVSSGSGYETSIDIRRILGY